MKYPEVVVKKDGPGVIAVSPDQLLEVRANMGAIEVLDRDGDIISLDVRSGGDLAGKAIYLNDAGLDWIIGEDEEGTLVLVPLRRP